MSRCKKWFSSMYVSESNNQLKFSYVDPQADCVTLCDDVERLTNVLLEIPSGFFDASLTTTIWKDMRARDSQQLMRFGNVWLLPRLNLQHQINSEIDPFWVLPIAGGSGDRRNNDWCPSLNNIVKRVSRWRSKVWIGARDHVWFLVGIRIRFALRESRLKSPWPSNHMLDVLPDTS